VQIPATFRPDDACIITATSIGSRGVYGAIATAGEWGLKHGCAVAYTDKGSGNGAHDLNANAVNLIQGQRVNAGTAGTGSQFTANVSATDLAAFNSAFPNRWAYKHAHSQQNPEKDWGRDTLRAVQFAFYMLNEKFGTVNGSQRLQTITREKTIVIASSVSNGASGALGAAEQDTAGLIDGVAVGEPAINVNAPANLTIKRGEPLPAPRQYWDVTFKNNGPISEQDAQHELVDRLRESIRIRLMSEVPLGAFLSGGVDSSAVVAMMAGLMTEPVNTCSIGFNDPAYNESEFAALIAIFAYRREPHGKPMDIG